MADIPAYLTVGTAVSAKYRGAFCEARVKIAKRLVKCKVNFRDGTSGIVLDESIKGNLKAGQEVEAKHPETNNWQEGVVHKVTDASTYTVVFDDGDEKTLRRTSLCLQGDRHFHESETLDKMPLTDPENFGTPVMKDMRGSRKKRVPDSSRHEEDDDEEENEVEIFKRLKRAEPENAVGKVVVVEMNDRRKNTWFPALIVDPSCTKDIGERSKDHIVTRSFKDNKYYTVTNTNWRTFSSKDHTYKGDVSSLKTAVEKAVIYIETGQMPQNWDMDMLRNKDRRGTESGESTESSEDSSGDEYDEEKDAWLASLHKFMEERSTPINKPPVLGYRDLNLYKLYKLVQDLGGCRKVTDKQQWRYISSKMGIPPIHTSQSYNIKAAYNKYLFAFEEYNRKLGPAFRNVFTRTRRGPSLDRFSIMSPPKIPKEEEKKKDAEKEKEETAEARKEDKKEEKREAVEEKKLEEVKQEQPPPIAKKKTRRKTLEEFEMSKVDADDRKEREKEQEEKGKEEDREAEKKDAKNKAPVKKTKKPDKDDSFTKSEIDIELLYEVGEKVRVNYGRGRTLKIYEAKIVKHVVVDGEVIYSVHYAGWNNRYDETVTADRIVGSMEKSKEKRNARLKAKQDKEKQKEKETKEKQKREQEALKEKEQREREKREKEMKERERREKERKEKEAERIQKERQKELEEREKRERKEREEREKRERKEREEKEKRARKEKEEQERRERKEQEDREKKERKEREMMEKKERELREKREKELRERKEREAKERKERELKEKKEREEKDQEEKKRLERERVEEEEHRMEQKETEEKDKKAETDSKKTPSKRGRPPSACSKGGVRPNSPRGPGGRSKSPAVLSGRTRRSDRNSLTDLPFAAGLESKRRRSSASGDRKPKSEREDSFEETDNEENDNPPQLECKTSLGKDVSRSEHSEELESVPEQDEKAKTEESNNGSSNDESVNSSTAGPSDIKSMQQSMSETTQKGSLTEAQMAEPPHLKKEEAIFEREIEEVVPKVESKEKEEGEKKDAETKKGGKKRSKKDKETKQEKKDHKRRKSMEEAAAMKEEVQMESSSEGNSQESVDKSDAAKEGEERLKGSEKVEDKGEEDGKKKKGKKRGRKSLEEKEKEKLEKKLRKEEADADSPKRGRRRKRRREEEKEEDKSPSSVLVQGPQPSKPVPKELERKESNSTIQTSGDNEATCSSDKLLSMGTPPATPESSSGEPSSLNEDDGPQFDRSGREDSNGHVDFGNSSTSFAEVLSKQELSVSPSSSNNAEKVKRESSMMKESKKGGRGIQKGSEKKRKHTSSISEGTSKKDSPLRKRKSSGRGRRRTSSMTSVGDPPPGHSSSDTDDSSLVENKPSKANQKKKEKNKSIEESGSIKAPKETRSTKPCKYNFIVDVSKISDPDERINLIQKQLMDLRKIYLELKAEVATIDRRRKKFRRKEREAAAAAALMAATSLATISEQPPMIRS